MRGLNGKRVIITGGAGGIGSATAERFLQEGSQVVVLDCDDKTLRRIENILPSLSGTINTDVSDPDAMARGFGELDELLGGIDILINNTGISVRQDFLASHRSSGSG